MTGATESARSQLLRQLRRTIDHVKADTIPQTDTTVSTSRCQRSGSE